jgi:glycosyltransferase involved in cell wall biosynthesis
VASPLREFCEPAVIYNGVPDVGFRIREVPESPVRIGILGRIAPEKGHLALVRAVRRLIAGGVALRIDIGGEPLFSEPGYRQTLMEAAAGLPVEWCGWVSDTAAFLHGVDILAVPSAGVEATPRVVMEALSAGTPIVAFRSGGIPEILEDGRTCVFAAAGNDLSLAEALLKMIQSPELYRRISAEGRAEWERRFRLDRYVAECCEFMHGVANKQATAQRFG